MKTYRVTEKAKQYALSIQTTFYCTGCPWQLQMSSSGSPNDLSFYNYYHTNVLYSIKRHLYQDHSVHNSLLPNPVTPQVIPMSSYCWIERFPHEAC
jgi:hypothetical protein